MSATQNRVGIIGASGFLGLNLAYHLAQNPRYELTLTSRKIQLQPLVSGKNISWIALDLNDPVAIEKFLASVDRVVYLAHQGLPTREENWKDEVQNNLTPFANFLEQVRIQKRTQPLQVIYLSSGGAIYGSSETKKPWIETDTVAPTTTYGMLKLSAEQYLRHAVGEGVCKGVCLRVSNPYGNHFQHIKEQGIIDVAVNKLKTKQPLKFFAAKEFVRDFIHIDDVNRAIEACFQLESGFEILNIGSGVGTNLKSVIAEIEAAFYEKLIVELTPPAPNAKSIPWAVLDITKAKTLLKWSPQILLRDGIQKIAAKNG